MASDKQPQTETYSDGIKYYGELNAAGNKHGRGIKIESGGNIFIRYFDDGVSAPGNEITIWSDGDVDVGEVFLKDVVRRARGTRYCANGKTPEFEYAL